MDQHSSQFLRNLSFDPSSIISEEVFSSVFGQQEGISLGQFTTPPLESFAEFMALWVAAIDERLSFVEKYTPPYFLLFTNRGFTYNEYKLLFKEIQEEKYKYYPVFEFLRIPSKDALVDFRLDVEENLESYFQILTKTFHDTNRTGIVFFLQKLKTRIPLGELQKHAYISGSTGSGKSELMRLLFYYLQKSSEHKKTRSLIVLDPHGQTSKQIKTSHLNINSDRLIYIEPDLRKGWSPVINPLDIGTQDDTAIVARAQYLAEAIKEAADIDISVNMQAILIPAISLLLRMENTTLLDLIKIMKDDKELIAKGRLTTQRAHKEVFKDFLNPHFKRTKIAIYTKLQTFLNYPAFYNMVIGKSTIDIGKAINSGKVVVFNLSQGYFGPDASSALGRFIISLIKSHVISRKQYRKPTYLFVDECQKFISPSIENILEETRKYGLHLIMANQSSDRLGSIEKIVLSNTSVKLIGKNDSIHTAKKMSSITGTPVGIFHNLRDYHFYLKTSRSTGQIFKASDALLLDKSLTMSQEQERQLNKKLINKYYRQVEKELTTLDEKEDQPLFDL